MSRFLLLGLLPLCTTPVGAIDKYVAPADASVSIRCKCIAGKSGCQSKVFDKLSGSERVEWSQRAQMKKNTEYNLDMMCYRKRDAKGAGEGLCCEVPGDEAKTVKQLFRGTAE